MRDRPALAGNRLQTVLFKSYKDIIMKLCIPVSDQRGVESLVYGHFGSAPFFAFVDTDTNAIKIEANDNKHHSHGDCHPMAALASRGVDTVLCTAMGGKAVQILNAAGIRVVSAAGDTAGAAVKLFKAGEAQEFSPEQACSRHGRSHS
jgi:predicted Fe-Mo cluster-binding NifX family protein